jgi:pyruvate formate lyase activating enzyme
MCKWLSKNGFSSTPLHLSRFYPVHKLEQLPPTPVSILNDAAGIAMEEGLKYVYTGNVPGNEISDTICHKCNATLVERKGFRVASNRIIDGKCPNCGYSIDGIWN